jgi:hypothetical protein
MNEFDIRNIIKYLPQIINISPKKNLFIHIPKNGGMSIRHAAALQNRVTIANRHRLKSKEYVTALKNSAAADSALPGYEHARLRDINIWVRYSHIPFAIVRNPWARVFSRFMYAIQTRNWDLESCCNSQKFEEFLEERHIWGGMEFGWHRAVRGWCEQVDYLTQEDGTLIPNVLRQERLSKEVKEYFRLRYEIDRVNITRGPRLNYRDFYCERTIQIVADWYSSDISKFGFDFDTMASKNTLYSSR